MNQFKDFSFIDEDVSRQSSQNSTLYNSSSTFGSQKLTELNQKRHTITKEAVIRMFILSTSIILINCLASINTIINLLN